MKQTLSMQILLYITHDITAFQIAHVIGNSVDRVHTTRKYGCRLDIVVTSPCMYHAVVYREIVMTPPTGGLWQSFKLIKLILLIF